MWVESVTTGSPQYANTLNRCGSTSMLSTRPPVASAIRDKIVEQIIPDSFLVRRHGIDIDQRARQLKDIHKILGLGETTGGPVLHRFPIALHPRFPDDSGQALTQSTNRRAGEPGTSISARLPRSPGAPDTRRNRAPGYYWPPLLYQDFFRIPRRVTSKIAAINKRPVTRVLTVMATRISVPPS